jgi:hypothetical protein
MKALTPMCHRGISGWYFIALADVWSSGVATQRSRQAKPPNDLSIKCAVSLPTRMKTGKTSAIKVK